jgi:peroxiredoxin
MLKFIRPFLCVVSLFAATLGARSATPEIAASPEAAKPLAVGAHAPAITLTDLEGATVDLAKAFAEKPTILVFYRGSWCPFCNRQLAALGELEPKLLAMGYQIIAVSPDSADGLKKMTGKNHLDYRLLSDRAMDASLAFGVAFRVSAEMEKSYHGYGIELTPIPGGAGTWLPVPTVFIVGRDGVIKFVYSNPDYKVRLASADLLAAAEAAAK